MERQYEILEPSFGISKNLIVTLIVVCFALITALPIFFGVNDASTTTVIQRPGGTFSVKTDHGIYFTGGGKVTVFKKELTCSFTNSPILVMFNDGRMGRAYGKVKFKMPVSDDTIIRVHRAFTSNEQLIDYLCIPATRHIVQLTAAFMSSGDAQNPVSKEKFAKQVYDQMVNGHYTVRSSIIIDRTGRVEKIIGPIIMRDSDGKPLRGKNWLSEYGISVVNLEITDLGVYD